MTTALELWDKLRQQPHSWLPTGRVFPFVLTPNERETVLKALFQFTTPEAACPHIRSSDEGTHYCALAARPEELSPEVVDLLRAAREALHRCYDVQAYPGDGKTVQDGVISRIDAFLDGREPQREESK